MSVAPSKRLAGKIALVTGASGVIGREIALAAAREGAAIIAHVHTSGAAGPLCRELRETGVEAWAIEADFRDPDVADLLFEKALGRCGNIDLLVNSASIFAESTLQNVTWADMHDAMLVNTWAPFALCRGLSRLGGSGRGAKAVVNLLDSRIVGGDAQHAGYIMSKHLLAKLTRMLAMAFAPALRVNAVAPGLIAEGDTGGGGRPCEAAKNLPLGRAGHPREVADAVIFLLQSESITGQVVYVDGGRHVRERAPRSHRRPLDR